VELILFSSNVKSKSEIPEVVELFENGLEIFHVKKNKWSKAKMKTYLKAFPSKYHNRLVLHSHYSLAISFKLRGIHIGKRQKQSRIRLGLQLAYLQALRPKLKVTTSFYNIQELISAKGHYDYALLKPVFDRHGTRTFSSLFNKKQLENAIEKSRNRIFALGGVTQDKIETARECGFAGVALQNTFWNKHENRKQFFQDIQYRCANPGPVARKVEIKPVQIDLDIRS
jgi:thiamine-phosphate pyrophosphorylase